MEVASLFVCRECRATGLEQGSRSLTCPACRARYPAEGGFYDLLDTETRGEPTAVSTEQHLMESELVARLYDRTFRPAFVRLLGGRGASKNAGGMAGEVFIYKTSLGLDDRDGPWLDLSCGTGTLTRALAGSAPGDWVVGIDISRPMLEVAGSRLRGYSNAILARADAHELPLAPVSIGGVVIASALHVYDDPERVFNELFRVLVPGGVFVGSAFHHKASIFHRLAGQIGGIRRFDPYELRGWLSRVGFVDYEEIRLGGSFIFRIRKP